MKLLILSRSLQLYSTKRLQEEALLAQHETSVIDYMQCHVMSEKNTLNVVYNGKPLTDIGVIIPRIGATFTHYGATVIRQFEKQKTTTLLSSKALIKSRDKLYCIQELAADDIAIPKTVFSHYLYNLEEIIVLLGGFPLVLKQIEGTQGHGVYLIKNRRHATEIIKLHQASNKKFILQEFISEANGADIRVFVIGNKVIAGMKRQAKQGEFRSNIHQGGKGENVTLTQQEIDIALRATQNMGLSVAGVDLLRSKRGPLLLEVNASPGLEGIEKATGINVAKKIIQYVDEIV